ncbi:MAG: hypothetical protein JJU45_16270 [Acidimicrobiia bacterium]|nr:hypothetical protein [Acidimicrobiia bacterium]
MSRRHALAFLAAAGLLVAAACGDSGDSGESESVASDRAEREVAGSTSDSRSDRRTERQERFDTAEGPTVRDHWHVPYGIFVCDRFLPPLADQGPDTTGVHTHEDGLVHVHPFSRASTGQAANWGLFGEAVGIEFTETGFVLDGRAYDDTFDCDGEPVEVVIYEWTAEDLDGSPYVHLTDLADVWFYRDGLIHTLSVAPVGADVPPPPQAELWVATQWRGPAPEIEV